VSQVQDIATPGPWRSYKERLAALSQRLVEAQRPIRVLQAVNWPPSVFQSFRDSGYREMPIMGPEQYADSPLGFDAESKRD
jgi:hypothetical protein